VSKFRDIDCIQSRPSIAPLFVHCNLWQCIECSIKSKYSIISNFCLQTPCVLNESGTVSGFEHIFLNPVTSLQQWKVQLFSSIHYVLFKVLPLLGV